MNTNSLAEIREVKLPDDIGEWKTAGNMFFVPAPSFNSNLSYIQGQRKALQVGGNHIVTLLSLQVI